MTDNGSKLCRAGEGMQPVYQEVHAACMPFILQYKENLAYMILSAMPKKTQKILGGLKSVKDLPKLPNEAHSCTHRGVYVCVLTSHNEKDIERSQPVCARQRRQLDTTADTEFYDFYSGDHTGKEKVIFFFDFV